MADDDGIDTAPWYVRFFVRVGLPTAFASILLWYLLTNVTGNLDGMRATLLQLSANQSLIVGNQMKIIELVSAQGEVARLNARALEALCLNMARSDAERARCSSAIFGR